MLNRKISKNRREKSGLKNAFFKMIVAISKWKCDTKPTKWIWYEGKTTYTCNRNVQQDRLCSDSSRWKNAWRNSFFRTLESQRRDFSRHSCLTEAIQFSGQPDTTYLYIRRTRKLYRTANSHNNSKNNEDCMSCSNYCSPCEPHTHCYQNRT